MAEPQNTPFFSVVIPTYKRAELLTKALESVLAQTYQDFEVIVADDGPDEETRAVTTSFKDPRISYYVNGHKKGGAGTRNAGIERATGQWVAFLDDDDIWLPTKLERQFEKIQASDSEVGLVYTGFARVAFDTAPNKFSVSLPQKEGWLYKDLLYKNHIGTFSTVVIRRDILSDIGGLDERFPALQDVELYLRVADRVKVVYIKQVLVHLRQDHEVRITKNTQSRLLGTQLFWKTYRADIRRSAKLSAHAASLVYLAALNAEKRWISIRVFPWVFVGLFADTKATLVTLRRAAGIMRRKRKQKKPPVAASDKQLT